MKPNLNEFRGDNTEGYTESQLQRLNEEWAELAISLKLEKFTDEYDFQLSHFSDEVARR